MVLCLEKVENTQCLGGHDQQVPGEASELQETLFQDAYLTLQLTGQDHRLFADVANLEQDQTQVHDINSPVYAASKHLRH
jgi:hypothetical protein